MLRDSPDRGVNDPAESLTQNGVRVFAVAESRRVRYRSGGRDEAQLFWAPDAFLRAERVGEWEELPLWIVDPEFAGMMDVHPARIPARPLEDTIRDVLAAGPAPADGPGHMGEQAGLSPEREAHLLGRLRARRT
jgi:hypothetical protein